LVGTHLVRSRPAHVDVAVTRRRSAGAPGVPAHRVDLRDTGAVHELFARVRPEVVVHTAYSKDLRSDIVDASACVASACAASGASLVHLSSDVVFAGDDPPYAEDDPVAPVNDYGRWKAEAEAAVRAHVHDACVVRLSLVVSDDPHDAGSRWLLDQVAAGHAPTLFHDEVRCPIRAEDLAAQLWALVSLEREERSGVWHLPGPEALSRWELGRRVLIAAGLDPSAPVRASAAEHPEPRPRDLTMSSRRRVPGPDPRPL
jgi:dTDP-4-dehydrorhamnose reductase